MQVAAPEPVRKQATTCPIFILGITGRCGTNYLHDLLRLHPDCTVRLPIWEDSLLYFADPLTQYVNDVCAYWRGAWKIGPEEEARLWKSLGDGLQSYLRLDSDGKRVVTKTPTVGNLPLFFKLFPEAPLLIIYRDGRAVVESAMKSFETGFEKMTRIWAENARVIRRFVEDNREALGARFLLVRYEDLFQNVRREMSKILDFLGLDAGAYDLGAAENLPIKGSSTYKGGDPGKLDHNRLNWEPTRKTAEFRPLERFSHWSTGRHRRFNWLAGAELRELGYEPQDVGGGPVSRLWNRLLDAKWEVRGWLGRNWAAARRRLLGKGRAAAGGTV